MLITTFDELTAFATQHFPENFARLPPASCFTINNVQNDQPRLLVGEVVGQSILCVVFAHIDPATGLVDYDSDVDYDGRNIRLYEPFCWLHPFIGDNADGPLKMEAFVRYCFAANRYSGYLESMSDVGQVFQQVCEDIVRAQDMKKSLLGIKEGAEDEMQRLNAELEAFKAVSANERQALVKEKVHLQTRVEGLEKDLKNRMDEVVYLKTELENARADIEKQAKSDNKSEHLGPAQDEAEKWKRKYEELRDTMRSMVTEEK